MNSINYEPLREWMRINRVDQKRLAGSAKVSQSTVSRWMANGLPASGEAMLAWMRDFAWTHQELARFCLNGPMPICPDLLITPEEHKRLQALDIFVEALK